MIDERKAHELQAEYLLTRSPEKLSELYTEVKNIAKVLILLKIKNFKSKEEIEDLSHLSATRFIENYLSKDHWICKYFAKRINFEVIFYLYPRSKRSDSDVELMEELEYEEVKEEPENLNFVLQEIKDDTEEWEKIFLLCNKAKTYKDFIIGITAYVTKQWIYDHAKRLYKFYYNTRG
jgi:hypothetical protein